MAPINSLLPVPPQCRGACLYRLLVACLLLLIVGCDTSVRKRPYGYIRLGTVKEFLAPETYLPDKRLLIRHDANGLSIMSTECTHDLSPLKRQLLPDGRSGFVSDYSTSTYTDDGLVVSGPTKAELPFFNLIIERGTYGGPFDTLYVEIGKERARSWRLPLPTER